MSPNDIKALYGTFNLDMLPLSVADVTGHIVSFVSPAIIKIPTTLNFDAYFGGAISDGNKFLRITIDDKHYHIANDRYLRDIEIDLTGSARKLRIIYYVYLNPNSNWMGIISSQLLQLKSYGILNESQLYIHVTDCFGLFAKVKGLMLEIVQDAIFSVSEVNQFEYPGIKLIYDLARQYPSDNFIYFHSKGMSHNVHSRVNTEINLFTKTFKRWRRHLQLLENGICKAGLFPAILDSNTEQIARGGWIWYNYWYATGEYLSKRPQPILTADRYYYEGWLGMQDDGQLVEQDCRSLYEIQGVSKDYFTPTEADFYLNFPDQKPNSFKTRALQALGRPSTAYKFLNIGTAFKNLFKK